MAYCLNIPIYKIDSLSLMAVTLGKSSIVALKDKNGAFLGSFDSNCFPLGDFKYINLKEFDELSSWENIATDIEIDYDKVCDFVLRGKSVNPHAVNPLYVKGISSLNDK